MPRHLDHRLAPRVLLLLLIIGGWGCAGGVKRPYIEDLYRELQETPDPAALEHLRGKRVLIDPGHGGRFTGTAGVVGTREADVNLGVALYLWGLLTEAGADAYLTRTADRDLLPEGSDLLADDLAARVALIDSLQPDVFLSLHHNANPARDPEANRIETYYPMGDEGPSRDLARAIHRHLVTNLGIPDQEIRSGNFYVLRNASVPAVLGEPSYLTNPRTEDRLRLSAKQRLEAGAYFLGLVDYFSRGLPRFEWVSPASDTIRSPEPLVFRVWDDGGPGIDLQSLEVRVNAVEVAVLVEGPTRTVVWPMDPEAENGEYRIEAEVRNLLGNRSHLLERVVLLDRPPATIHLQMTPGALPGGSPSQIHLVAGVRDAGGRPVLDGVPVRWRAAGLRLVRAAPVTAAGLVTALGIWHPGSGDPPDLAIEAGAITAEWHLPIAGDSTTLLFPRVLDGPTGRPLDGVRVSFAPADTQMILTRRDGSFLWNPARGTDGRPAAGSGSGRVDSSQAVVWKEGYRIGRLALPGKGSVDSPIDIPLEPLFGETPFSRTLVLDPAGGGGDPGGTGPTGLRGAWAGLEVARIVRGFLRPAGVRCILTRGGDEGASDVDRIHVSQREGADLFLRLSFAGDPSDTTGARLLHFPGSQGGSAFARFLADRLQEAGTSALSIVPGIGEDTRAVLRDTPCPAVIARPLRIERPAHEAFLDRAADRVALAYALALAVLDYFFDPDPDEGILVLDRSGVPGAGPYARFVLDRRWTLIARPDEPAVFRRLQPGPHLLEVHDGGRPARPLSSWLRIAPGQTLHVLGAPIPR